MIGWFGVDASILYGLGNALKYVKPNVKALWNLGGLLIWVFEFVLGGGLLFTSLNFSIHQLQHKNIERR